MIDAPTRPGLEPSTAALYGPDSRQAWHSEGVTETDLTNFLHFVERTTDQPEQLLAYNIGTHAGAATGVYWPRLDDNPYIVVAVEPSGFQNVHGIVHIPTTPQASWRATGLFSTHQITSSDACVPQEPDPQSWLYSRNAVDVVIRYCQDRHEFKVAERIHDLAAVEATDDQDLMDQGSLLAAVAFVDQRRRDARAQRRVLQNVIGIGYPAVWLTHCGEVQLLWETEDQRLSIVVTCRRDGRVNLNMHEGDRDWSEEMSLDEALANSRAFLTKIT